MMRSRAKTDLYRKSFDWLTELACIRMQLPLSLLSSFYYYLYFNFFFFFALQTWNSISSKANHQHYPPTSLNPSTHNTIQMAKGAEGFSDGTYPVFPSQRSISAAPQLETSFLLNGSEPYKMAVVARSGVLCYSGWLHTCAMKQFLKRTTTLNAIFATSTTFTVSSITLSRPQRHQ